MTSPQTAPFRAGHPAGEQPAAAHESLAAHPAVTLPGVTLLADISEFQPEINDAMYLLWSKAIVIRAAYGAAHDDKAWFGGQRRDLLHAGGARFVGIYQYVVAGQDPVTQARALAALLGRLRPGEKVIGDFEEGTGNQSHRRDVWAATIQARLGNEPWIYSGLNYARDHGLAPVDWVAAYGQADPPVPYRLWQFTDAFQVPGVGTADCSVFHGSIGELAALAFQPQAAPQPRPAQEDTVIVLDLPAAGPATVLPVPAGAAALTLHADPGYKGVLPPQVRVIFNGAGQAAITFWPTWANPAVTTVPAGATRVSLARLDPGATPVTAAWS